jgi:NAD(P)-dependent dehydrogenase (short-subunit alcohol dehydrogenase family)
MQIAGQAALVTGANPGFGRHLAQQSRDRGATVYAGARNPDSVDLDGVKPVRIDVTDSASVAVGAAAAAATATCRSWSTTLARLCPLATFRRPT